MEGFWPSKNQPMYGNQRFLYLAFFRRTYQINPLDASYQNSLCWGEYNIWKLMSNCPWSKIKLYHFVFYTLECVHVFCLFVDSIWLQHWTPASWGSTLGMCSLTLLLSAAESLQYQQVPFIIIFICYIWIGNRWSTQGVNSQNRYHLVGQLTKSSLSWLLCGT